MSARWGGGHRVQRGQAMTELVIMMIVLLPMVLLVPVIGKYIHLRHLTQQAARAAAWEAAVSPDYAVPDAQTQQAKVVDRYFGGGDAAIATVPQSDGITSAMLGTFSGQPLATASGITVGYRDQASPGPLGEVAGLLAGLPLPWAWQTPNADGFVGARLDVDVQQLKYSDGTPARFLAPFDTMQVSMSSEHALVVDPWNAAGSGDASSERTVVRQTTPLVLTRVATECEQEIPGVLCPLAAFNEAMAPLAGLPIPFVEVPGRLMAEGELGLIEPDVVPYDKLKPYVP